MNAYIFVSLPHLLHELLLLRDVEVELGHLHGVGFALLLGEREDDAGREVPLHDHLHQLEAVGAPCALGLAALGARLLKEEIQRATWVINR